MIVVNHECCDRCGACVAVCRGDALVLTERLKVNPQRCIGCNACVSVCPVAALRQQAAADACDAAGVSR